MSLEGKRLECFVAIESKVKGKTSFDEDGNVKKCWPSWWIRNNLKKSLQYSKISSAMDMAFYQSVSTQMIGYWVIYFNRLIKNYNGDIDGIKEFFKNDKNIMKLIEAQPQGQNIKPYYFCLSITDGDGSALPMSIIRRKYENEKDIGKIIYNHLLERVNDINRCDNIVLCQKDENIQNFFDKYLFN